MRHSVYIESILSVLLRVYVKIWGINRLKDQYLQSSGGGSVSWTTSSLPTFSAQVLLFKADRDFYMSRMFEFWHNKNLALHFLRKKTQLISSKLNPLRVAHGGNQQLRHQADFPRCLHQDEGESYNSSQTPPETRPQRNKQTSSELDSSLLLPPMKYNKTYRINEFRVVEFGKMSQ